MDRKKGNAEGGSLTVREVRGYHFL